MTRLAFLLPLALAACANAGGGLLSRLEPEPEGSEPLPVQVIAALPAGVPPSVVTRNADGCYLITLEMTNPPTGFPLTDAAGNRVCEVAASVDATAAAEAEGAGSAAPALAEPDPA